MIHLRPDQLDAIRRHGEADYPDECCGLLIGTLEQGGGKNVREVMPLPNAREEGLRRNRFLISPQDLLRGERHARASRQDVIGFYHSHPDHPAQPSRFDLDQAWPVYSYVIVSVVQGQSAELLCWKLRPDRSAFEPQEIVED